MNKDKITISRRSATHLIAAMIAGGTFMRLVIDGDYLNSAWICLLGGSAISLPAVVVIDKYSYDTHHIIWRLCCITAAAYMLFQTAAVSRLLVNSVSYSNYITFSPLLLSIIMMLACLYIILKRKDGIGNAVKVCAILFMILLVIVLVSNMKYMNIRWLTPYVSVDAGRIAEGCVATAGYILSVAILYIPAENTGIYRHGCLKAVTIGVAIALVLCLYTAVLSPMQFKIEMNRLRSIELLLSNGRTSLGVQLPITLIWFIGYIVTLASYIFAGAVFVQQICRDLSPEIVAVLCSAIVFIIANTGLAESRQVIFVSRIAIAYTMVSFAAAFLPGRKRQNED